MHDIEIIQNIQAGKTNEFKRLVEKHQSIVFRTALGFVHIKEDAEDLTQEVFIRVFQSLGSFQGNAEFSTWLYRITVNVCLNHLNKNKGRGIIQFAEDMLKSLFNKTMESKNPVEELIEAERETVIRNAIDSLPEKQRTAFVLSKYDELSQKEIAQIMQISEGAVEQHLQRGKINLQKKLGQLVGK